MSITGCMVFVFSSFVPKTYRQHIPVIQTLLQKGSVENKHEKLRYVCPKEKSLRKLGLISQEKMNLAASYVNSAPRKKLGGKYPLECIEFGTAKIERDKVILKSELLK